jgi:hypothetical protein
MVTLNGDQITYLIGNEPRCAKVELSTDCQGYWYSGRSTGYIYYGEEDTRMVTWEIVTVFYEAVEAGVQNVRVYEEGGGAWDRAQRRVDDYNEAMERSGVFVEFKLVAVLGGRFGGASIGLAQYYKLDELGIGADVAIGWGSTCDGAGGCAFVNKNFRLYGEWSSRVEPDNTNPAGSREYADSAYHLNRVRYDVSLINNENDWKPEANDPLQFIKVEAQRNDRILVID